MKLHTTSERFLVEPETSGKKDVLVIDRLTQELFLQDGGTPIPASAITKTIYGIVGVIKLIAGSYLIVITKREKVGNIQDSEIWKVTGTEVISYKRSLNHLTEKQVSINKSYLALLDQMLNTESFYFSTTYDLTHSMQRLYNTSPDFKTIGLFERADQRFVWNSHVLRELSQQPDLAKFCMPLMLGFFSISRVQVNKVNLEYIVISRRCIFRAGTRFNVRGVDLQGNVANFVETEQIVISSENVCSFVQTRGSIPLFWSQKADLRRLPKPVVIDVDHSSSFSKHFDQQVFVYGYQVIVNLINQHGSEAPLEKALNRACAQADNKNVRYEAFDFHKECSKMRWDRLSILQDRLAPERQQFGFFHQQSGGQIISTQSGVFRTNCMDCLDRTNVVQSLLARDTLQTQLQKLAILDVHQKITEQKQFDEVFRNVWADNADAISKEYAGTGALKTDFTRTGCRTKYGALQDGYNSAVRYIKNNFQDGSRQDAMDLFLGNYIVEEGEGLTVKSPLDTDRDWKYYAVPIIFIVAFSMFAVSVLLPDEHLSEQLLYVLFWGVSSFTSLMTIFFFGKVFVEQPHLVHNKLKSE